MTISGSCNCGGVKYEVSGPMRAVTACHCGQCSKQTGHFYAATSVEDDDLNILQSDTLKWYAASDQAKRGFCGECGAGMFWKRNDSSSTSILVGSLDGDTGLRIERHIFVADKGDYYEIEDGLPQFQQSY